ncbi:MAG: hypothetical protein J2P58_12840, partial [Acidimicrobiaceae bacterium]|nr:hypothetical protein [Acidimicrobiaceae bacterium]
RRCLPVGTAKGWRRGLMYALVVAVVAGAFFAAAPLARADGRSALQNHTTKCTPSHNVCETVVNAIKGSDFIMWIRVWDEHSSARRTMRELWDGSVRGILIGDVQYPGGVFYVDYTTRKGMCIQGGIVGVGRTPCWYAP